MNRSDLPANPPSLSPPSIALVFSPVPLPDRWSSPLSHSKVHMLLYMHKKVEVLILLVPLKIAIESK
jgi:hypothetical protein